MKFLCHSAYKVYVAVKVRNQRLHAATIVRKWLL